MDLEEAQSVVDELAENFAELGYGRPSSSPEVIPNVDELMEKQNVPAHKREIAKTAGRKWEGLQRWLRERLHTPPSRKGAV